VNKDKDTFSLRFKHIIRLHCYYEYSKRSTHAIRCDAIDVGDDARWSVVTP